MNMYKLKVRAECKNTAITLKQSSKGELKRSQWIFIRNSFVNKDKHFKKHKSYKNQKSYHLLSELNVSVHKWRN